MNERADELAFEAGTIIFRQSQHFKSEWQKIFVIVKFWEGATQETCWYQKTDGDREFFFIDDSEDLSVLLIQLQKEVLKGGRRWVACMVEVGCDRKLQIEFEYENRDRWANLHCVA